MPAAPLLRTALVAAITVATLATVADAAPAAPSAASTGSTASGGSAATAKTGTANGGVDWQRDDVDGAFARAKAERKPVFLYWGATWCPPCNQVKATVFNRQDFIERSRHFVAVYVDGDRPGAQKQGARFKVSGYPTMILFTPDGKEITRLPGEVDADQYMRVLALGMGSARPIKETLAAALANAGKDGAVKSPTGPSPRSAAGLTANDWQMLAYYSWVTDDGELVPADKLPATLARLAQACPPTETASATRLRLQALAAAATAKAAKPATDPGKIRQIEAVLADAGATRVNFDLLTYQAGAIAGYVTVPNSPERAALARTWDAALERLAAGASLAAADRLVLLRARVELARKANGDAPLPDPLAKLVGDEAQRVDRETTDPYARQAVVSDAAELLAEAGMLDASDALLKTELTRSHSPYYAMVGLAVNAKKRGDKAAALDWREKSYAAAVGPATRLQWGAGYVNALIELAPQDSARIEKAASQVFGELEPVPDTFYDRNRRVLERVGRNLAAWGKTGPEAATLARLDVQLGAVCAKLPAKDPARAACAGVLKAARPTQA